jgi:hypothetical protein
MTRIQLLRVAAALAATTAGPAWADRYEASLGLSANGGAARIGEPGTTAAWAGGLGLGAPRQLRDRQHVGLRSPARRLRLAAGHVPEVERDILGEVERGAVTRRTIAAALTGGVELRLGPRLIPDRAPRSRAPGPSPHSV